MAERPLVGGEEVLVVRFLTTTQSGEIILSDRGHLSHISHTLYRKQREHPPEDCFFERHTPL